jgi:hypothetical protein
MKQLRSNYHVSLSGKPVTHIADVPVYAKSLLEQEQPWMRPTPLRTHHIRRHPSSMRDCEFHFLFYDCRSAHAISISRPEDFLLSVSCRCRSDIFYYC